jgi:hypothetical protein
MTGNMETNELEAIEECVRAHGATHTREAITANLLEMGHSRELIDRALRSVHRVRPAPPAFIGADRQSQSVPLASKQEEVTV